MAKVYVDAGHGGADNGAVKYVTEDKVNLVMALACRDYLKSHGVDVKMSRTADTGTSINNMANEANKWGADLVISIHNNAGGGDGFEVYHHYGGGKGKTLAKNIETEIKAIGQNSRGLKTKKNSQGLDYFGMIRLTNAPCVICEGAFVDNATDVKIIDTEAEQKAFGIAYAKGILKTLGITENSQGKPAENHFVSTLTKGSNVKIRRGAKDLNNGKTYQDFVYKNTYTVIEIKGDRVVFGLNGAVTGATSRSNIILLTAEKPKTLTKGLKVKIKAGATDLNTKSKYAGFVYKTTYTVISISGDRVVFGINGVATGATSKSNIIVL